MYSISPEISGIRYIITNKNDCIQNKLLNGSQWNEDIVHMIKQYISTKKLTHFLNIGSHIGSVCLPVSLYIKNVTAIEAYPNTYEHLRQNILLNHITNVHTINIAVGNSEEDVYFMSDETICPVENINRVKNNSGRKKHSAYHHQHRFVLSRSRITTGILVHTTTNRSPKSTNRASNLFVKLNIRRRGSSSLAKW